MAADVIKLLAELVQIDSANPSLAPGAPGEGQAAAHVARWARAAGLAAEMVEQTPGRPSVIVRGGQGAGGRTLLLCGHLDTVGLSGMTSPLTPRIDGDRLFGRGAYDMKAGLAAALVACRDATAAGISGEVIVAAVADEEHASAGVQQVISHLARRVDVDAAVVTEPTELTVATAHKGFVWTEIEVTGVAAHGSRPQLGIDAITHTGPVLVALAALNESLARHQHPALGPGTVHASLIKGGTEESTIPDRCVLTIERRTLPGELAPDIEAEVAGLLAACRAADPALTVSSRTVLARDPLETDSRQAIVTALQQAAEPVLGHPASITAMSYWADSAFLSAAGIPTVLFGPDGDGAHADTEWVSLSGTAACASILTRAARAFCSRS